MKVRIQSLGTPESTRIFNSESGEEIKGIVSVTWRIVAGGRASVLLEFDETSVNVEGEVLLEEGT